MTPRSGRGKGHFQTTQRHVRPRPPSQRILGPSQSARVSGLAIPRPAICPKRRSSTGCLRLPHLVFTCNSKSWPATQMSKDKAGDNLSHGQSLPRSAVQSLQRVEGGRLMRRGNGHEVLFNRKGCKTECTFDSFYFS